MILNRKLFQREYRILNLYEEYKMEYEKLGLIGIVPNPIMDLTTKDIAYTDNAEMMDCITHKKNVTLYYSEKLFQCSDRFIKAVLFHEFTHISDAYNFVGMEYSNFFMSTYSEFNAMRVEILLKNGNKIPMLDDTICDENGVTTPRKEIEGYLNFIINTFKSSRMYPEKIKEKAEQIGSIFLKSYSWMFAYLSFYEETEKKYFESCFNRLEKCKQKELVKELYKEIQSVEYIKSDSQKIVLDIVDLYSLCFE